MKEASPKLGGEIKWAVNPNSVLDFTFNTDFAQADVDRAVNNLTRFNVFFPERRQFFLENSGIYPGSTAEGILPFFSRTIGLANAQFNADAVPIDAGLRFTNRNIKRSLAGMYVHQRATDTQGASNFTVLRYLKNYGEQNNLGVMLTSRIDEQNIEAETAQQNNTTLTFDGLIRPSNNLSFNYLVSASRNNSNDSIGLAGSFYVGWFPQKAYLGWTSKLVDRKYFPGMGFVFANNTIHHNPGGYYIWRPKGKLGKKIRRWDPGIFVNYYQNANNLKTQEVNLYLFPVYIITSSNAQIEYAIFPTWQTYDFGFSILGKQIPLGQYQVLRQLFRFDSDASRKLSGSAKYEFGGYFNGKLQSARISGRLAPVPHFALSLSYDHNSFKDFGELREDFQTNLYSAGLRVAVNPRIQASAFYQYNSFDNQSRWNIRGSWEFAPLSFVYLVFNESVYQSSGISSQSTISKISLMKQF